PPTRRPARPRSPAGTGQPKPYHDISPVPGAPAGAPDYCGQLPSRIDPAGLFPGRARITGRRPAGQRQARWASVNVADLPFVVAGPLVTGVDPPQGGNRPRC